MSPALPRTGPEPEPNIIQKPELQRYLQQALGLRQAHIAPTLNPEIQPVIIVQDINTSARALPIRYACFAEVTPIAGEPLFSFFNPPASGVLARIRKYKYVFSGAGDILNFCLANQDVPMPGASTIKPGQRMFTGLVQVTPLSEQPKASQVKLYGAEGASFGLGRFLEIHLDFISGGAGILELDFDIVLGPGSSFSTFEHVAPFGVARETYLEWEEEPIT